MVRKRVYAIAVVGTLVLAASAMGSGLFLDRGDQRQSEVAVRRVLEEQKSQLGNLAYLRLQFDSKNQVRLLDQRVVDGQWKERDVGLGARLYYEVLDGEGTVIARGVRRDPRDDVRSSERTPVNFILAMPRAENAAQVVIYSVDYEPAGQRDYERGLRPLAVLDVK